MDKNFKPLPKHVSKESRRLMHGINYGMPDEILVKKLISIVKKHGLVMTPCTECGTFTCEGQVCVDCTSKSTGILQPST